MPFTPGETKVDVLEREDPYIVRMLLSSLKISKYVTRIIFLAIHKTM